MQLGNYPDDPTPGTLVTIKKRIDDAVSSVLRLTESSTKLAASSNRVATQFLDPNSLQGRFWGQSARFSVAVAERTQDVELAIQERRLNALIGSTTLHPISITQGDVTAHIRPLRSPTVIWTGLGVPRALADCLFIRTEWRVTVSGSAPRDVSILHSVMLNLPNEQRQITLAETNAPRYLDSSGEIIDPFASVPRKNSTRSSLKKQTFDGITRELRRIRTTLPALPRLPANFRPHLFHRDYNLVFVGRTLPKRRQRFPLWVGPIFHNQGIRLKKEHLVPEIRNGIETQGVRLQEITFSYGFIGLKVHRHDRYRFLWVTIDTDVWLTFELRFPQVAPALLRSRAQQVAYHWKYELKNCWPICDEVGEYVQGRIESEIRRHRVLTFPFQDLRSSATEAQAGVTPYGVAITMEVR